MTGGEFMEERIIDAYTSIHKTWSEHERMAVHADPTLGAIITALAAIAGELNRIGDMMEESSFTKEGRRSVRIYGNVNTWEQ